ncbi:MAG: AAA family ATPase [Planctomycetaceae bacterium]
MADARALARYLESASREARKRERRPAGAGIDRPIITISRLEGCGAHLVGEELVARFGELAPEASPPWTLFDRNLVEWVLQDHELPGGWAAWMPEDRVSEVADIVDGLFGLRPSSWVLVRKTAETILRLAQTGNVVVIGRGANVITARVPSAFRVRLVGSMPARIAYVREHVDVDPLQAAAYIRERDLGRKRYVRKYYDADIDDPLGYDLVVNTDRLACAETARIIVEAVHARQEATGLGRRLAG